MEQVRQRLRPLKVFRRAAAEDSESELAVLD